jgi:hypothetical protein
MKEKTGSFAKLAQTYSEILAAETRSNLSLERERKKIINTMDGLRKWKLVRKEVGRAMEE